jgi:hypothetical protein
MGRYWGNSPGIDDFAGSDFRVTRLWSMALGCLSLRKRFHRQVPMSRHIDQRHRRRMSLLDMLSFEGSGEYLGLQMDRGTIHTVRSIPVKDCSNVGPNIFFPQCNN